MRVSGNIMLINYERYKAKQELQSGLKIFDISDKTKPREIGFYKTHGKGVHRFTFDGRYAYISPTMEGYKAISPSMLDMKNPGKTGRGHAAGGCPVSGPPAARRATCKGAGNPLPPSNPPRQPALH